MVDITRCEACGRMIPATEQGCAYCDREREGQVDRPYLPLAIRLLLLLFALDLVTSGVLGVLTASSSGGPEGTGSSAVLFGVARVALAAATLAALVASRPWGRWFPLVFIGVEVLAGLAGRFGWIPPGTWRGDLLAPLWSSLFLFLFLRPDVQGRFDPKVWDRHEVGDLIRIVQRGGRDQA